MRIAWIAAGIVTSQSLVIAQTNAMPRFEAASVKPDDSGGNYIEVTPGMVTAHSATLSTCIMWAYQVQSGQVSGAGPGVSGLLNSERYSIVAKTTGAVPERQLRLMMQTLLTERFQLALHRDSKELQAYALITAKNGAKFSESHAAGESTLQASSKLNRRWTSTSMGQLADSLADAMQAPVLNQTGLTGKYDFSLDLTPYAPATGERPNIGAMMVTALPDQLGLRLEPRRTAVDILLIDHLQRPTAN